MTKLNKILIIFISLLILQARPLDAQDVKAVQDLQLWTGIEVEKTFFNALTISLEEEIRFRKDISELNIVFTQLGIEYDINDNFALAGKMRYSWNKGSDLIYDNEGRYSLDLKYKKQINTFSASYRLRYQNEAESVGPLTNSFAFERYLRQRIAINYTSLKRIRPTLSAEIFHQAEKPIFGSIDQVRILGGIRYKPKYIGQIKLEYGFSRELNTQIPATCFLIKVNYTYSF